MLFAPPRSLTCEADIGDYGLVSADQVVSYIKLNLDSRERELAVTILEDIASRATAAFCTYNTETALELLEKLGGSTSGVDKNLRQLRIVELEGRG